MEGLKSYKRPPITEAVIEFRFDDAVELRQLDSVSRAMSDRYPRAESLFDIDVDLQSAIQAGAKPASAASTRAEFTGYKRTSSDALEIIILGHRQFVVSRLAPYPGWDAYLAHFKREWSIWKSKVDHRPLSRIGVRFINRLDIPARDGVAHEEDFLNIRVRSPDVLGNFLACAAQARFAAPDINCHITVNTGNVPSPIPNFASVLLDIDVATVAKNLPHRDVEIFEFLDRMRAKKNEVFEASISDAARETFGR